MDEPVLTREGLEALRAELARLSTEVRPQLAEQVRDIDAADRQRGRSRPGRRRPCAARAPACAPHSPGSTSR